MRPTLPSPFSRDLRRRMLLGLVVTCVVACRSPAPPPVAPGPPIPADPEVALKSMPEECDAMIVALTAFRDCKNLEDEDKKDLDAWIERANQDLAAGRKAQQVNANDLRAMAHACHRATSTVEAATERCLAGPRPKNQ